MLLIAAGIGITPYLAHLAVGASRGRPPEPPLPARAALRGDRRRNGTSSCCTWQGIAAELAYAEELQRSGPASWPGLPTARRRRPSWRTRAPGRIDAAALKELVPDIAGREVFVSGSPASVRSLRAAARGAGARRVHVDSFTGY